jgi:hypothetical protein
MTQENLNDAVAVADVLNKIRDQMRAALSIGEPCVELPLSEVKAFKDDEGNWRAVIGMDQLVYFIDSLIRRS